MAGLDLTIAEGCAEIVIDNPGRRNALSAEMWERLPALLASLHRDDAVQVVVLRGAGNQFSSGADIGDLDRILLNPALPPGGLISRAEDALAAFPKPTVAMIDGHCVGGGWELAAACDLRVASARAVFAITPSRLGVVYPLTGIERLTRLVGPARAKYLLVTGESISAEQALSFGMLTSVVAHDALAHETRRLVGRLRDASQLSVQAAKELVDLVSSGGPGAEEAATRWRAEMLRAKEYVEGIDAFHAARSPRFTWRSSGDVVT